jgi:hypothetical protein
VWKALSEAQVQGVQALRHYRGKMPLLQGNTSTSLDDLTQGNFFVGAASCREKIEAGSLSHK